MNHRRQYFPHLDATRMIGLLHVFMAHCYFTSSQAIRQMPLFQFLQVELRAGFLGLDYFFVLSSFLLSWIIFEEIQAHAGRFKPIFFLIRRGLRLWPLYFLIVACTYLLLPWVEKWGVDLEPLPPIQAFLGFYINYYIIAHGQNFLFFLVFFWSIAVEEQFYVFWAVAMKFFYRYFHLLTATMILTSIAFRYYFHGTELQLLFNTVGLLGNFAVGAWAAWLAFYHKGFLNFIKAMSRTYILCGYLLFVPLLWYYFIWAATPWGIAIEKVLFALLFAFIILEQCFAEHSLLKFGRWEWLNYLGRISLGFYCYHGIVITFYRKWAEYAGWDQSAWMVFLINPLIMFCLTIALAIASFELFEKHIHALRRYFYP